MKNFLKILILPIAIVTILGGFADIAFAGVSVDPSSLIVVFDPSPKLFNQPNFLPLDETSGTVTVTNNSGATQDILTEMINISDSGNFGSLLRLKIVGSSGILFNNTLASFFATAGEFPLGAISAGESKTFTYTISFIDSSDNSYQGKTLGFDVCVGFSGGTRHCGDTVAGGENNTGDGGTGNPPPGGNIPGTGNRGGGGGGGIIILTIYNEQTLSIVNVPPTATATITWDTNILSTSQVVYGPTPIFPATYSLNMNAINFGYPSGTAEDTTKVLHHSVSITGLVPGQTYVYRVVSRASPPTISFEHTFTVPLTTPLLAQAGSNNFIGGNLSGNTSGNTNGSGTEGSSTGSGSSGAGSQEGAPLVGENDTNSNNNQSLLALAFLGMGNLLSSWKYWLLLAIILILIFFIVWRRRNRKSPNEIR